ncbi:hypothetical protein Cob_v012559 [Colletotrichum orbiculare MAFF 240422]|uniref:Uncharacterized protein n=1 Tax=Colletotrichum orbiculare (strain 104-T / ATCC 96160 / CBS 514.97 / LARS 414 / MAFF 240422) TaxID=1213857 RepID=A0A484F9B1_COLOR|nr:hypothetical protein Cob_v012559 [Colletotrichum orbiculare MAFF 240422]
MYDTNRAHGSPQATSGFQAFSCRLRYLSLPGVPGSEFRFLRTHRSSNLPASALDVGVHLLYCLVSNDCPEGLAFWWKSWQTSTVSAAAHTFLVFSRLPRPMYWEEMSCSLASVD